ncbi:MAG: alpha/beta hydrolase [Proteobacteria bacterium]|nr:alpha/beta hydrolase [Pseudomonadota bacterium]
MRVYFMTNRNQREVMPHPEFGFTPTDNIALGHAEIDGATANEDDIDPLAFRLTVRGVDQIPEDLAHEIEQSNGSHLLFYVHGFNYAFREAMQRTTWLSGWFGAGQYGVSGPALCFSFPSRGSTISFEKDPKSMHALFGSAYQEDYQRATESARAAARALGYMATLARRFRASRRPAHVTLLAHSMGNHVLGAALGAARDSEGLPAADSFDRVILAASDETRPSVDDGGTLRLAGQIGRKVYVYYNRQDLPLLVSQKVHGDERLGREGPPTTGNPAAPFRLPANFQVINCSTASPLDPQADQDWQHHQYYRLYPWVRDDMALVMREAADDLKDFPQRRRSFEASGLIDLDSPEMMSVSLMHPLVTVG